MNELQRQAYLRVMGVDSYFPRLQIPGAQPSQLCNIPVADVIHDSTQEGLPDSADNDVLNDSLKNHHDDVLATLRGDNKAKEKTSYQSSNRIVSNPDEQLSTALTFSLTAVLGGSNVLVLDKGISSSIDPQEYLRFLSNILFAIGVESSNLSLAPFVWPMIESNQIDQSEETAKQVLSAFLSKQVDQQKVKYIWLMGDDAKYYFNVSDLSFGQLQFHSELPIKVIATKSAVDMLQNPDIKPDVWREIQPLRDALLASAV